MGKNAFNDLENALRSPDYAETGAGSPFATIIKEIEKKGGDYSVGELTNIITLLDEASGQAKTLNKWTFRQAARKMRAVRCATSIREGYRKIATDPAADPTFSFINEALGEYRKRRDWTAEESNIILSAFLETLCATNNQALSYALEQAADIIRAESGDYWLGRELLDRKKDSLSFTDYLERGGNPFALLDMLRDPDYIASIKALQRSERISAFLRIDAVRRYSHPYDISSAAINACAQALSLMRQDLRANGCGAPIG